ncbi:MAG: class I SAM-dependent methyltransferase [Rikenellaceae bacterium]
MKLSLLTPEWDKSQYELLDSGNLMKLERFGAHVVLRPEPQALWQSSMSMKQWESLTDAVFVKNRGSEDKGQWELTPQMKEQWWIEYQSPDQPSLKFRLRMGLTSFKHIGVFPEQASNWEFIHSRVAELVDRGGSQPEVLNMFAYTGGATLAATTAGAKVTHVDSVKQTVSWSRENMEGSDLEGVRWVVEDALKFARREVRRGRKYQGIILDPPSYGRGADGEKWVLTDNILEMLKECRELLTSDGFLVLNLYSMGLSALLGRTLVESVFGKRESLEQGELYVEDQAHKSLPLGVFIRF